jgi:signal transduction histidine kinase
VNVLIVDDQPGKLLTYSAILEGIDANLVVAESARAALDLLLRTEFALVLIDVCMPELDGFELAAMIRDHPRFQRTAIIFVSAMPQTEVDRVRGYRYGAVDFLQVPIVPEILRSKVGVFVDLYRKTRDLEELNQALERRVEQRTAELEEASRHKDEFLAVLAHELRNPLAAIRSATQVIAFPQVPPAVSAKSIAVIQRQIEQLVRLIDDLVDVSRITRGIVELRRQPEDLGAIVQRAIESSRPFIDGRGHTLALNILPDRVVVNADAMRLTQVLGNVLHNAAKFTEPGGHITLTMQRDVDEVLVRVTDTGVGVAPEILPTVFELFTQVKRPLDRGSSGLGIGLALVHRLVVMHGGTVTISSEGTGHGAVVSIRLPVSDATTDVHETTAITNRPAPAPVRPCRVLVVDDNSDAADALAALLRSAGHDVLTAEDGVEALRVGGSFTPHVALLDLGMPRLNGYDTAKRIREQSWGQQVGLIAVTGWGTPKDRDRTLQAGFDAHLVKPVDDVELFDVLSRFAPRPSRRLSP